MKNKSHFSIIIPTLNEEKYLPKLLQNLKDQTYRDFEVIVVDGNSDDKTLEYAQKFSSRLNLSFITGQKRNVCFQRNQGAKNAKNEWIIFMDADNLIPNYYLQGIKYRLDKEDCDFFTTHIKPDSEHPLDLGIAKIVNTYFELQKNTKRPSFLESMIGCKKTSFSKMKGFDETYRWGEGTELLVRATKKGMKFSVFKDPIYSFSFRRLRSQGTINTARNVSKLIIHQIRKKPFTSEKISQIYPMEGGAFFDKKRKPTTNLESILKDIFNLSPKQLIKTFREKSTLSQKIEDFFNNL